MKPAVEIKNLSVTLGGQVKALKNVSLELPAGKAIGVIGPSGAGKTTLMRCLVGSLRVDDSSIIIFDQPAGSPELRSQVSYMAQGLSVFSDLTVKENLVYFATMIGKRRKEINKAVTDALEAVDLTDKTSSLVDDLSSGQKQRVSLAVALLGSPRLMVLDEPTIGLDPVLRNRLWALFTKLSGQGITLIVSSHSMGEAERCDDLVLLRAGKVISHSTPTELRRRTGTKTIEQSFLKLVGGKQ